MIEQGTQEWHQMRLGKVTASRISDVMAQGRGGKPSATRESYMAELVAERLTGEQPESFTNAAMQHGTETEPQARAQYTMRTGNNVVEIAFADHPDGLSAGASPDGLVGENGLVEIKCPKTSTHIKTLRGAAIDRKYTLQMHWQMICTGREWCDFVSYDPRLPHDLAMHIRRVDADAEFHAEITEAVADFLAELSALEFELRAMQERAA